MIESTLTSKLTSKGQTTIPQEIRQQIGAEPGTRLAWHLMPDGGLIVRAKNKSVLTLAGSLKPARPGKVAVSSMNAWR